MSDNNKIEGRKSARIDSAPGIQTLVTLEEIDFEGNRAVENGGGIYDPLLEI